MGRIWEVGNFFWGGGESARLLGLELDVRCVSAWHGTAGKRPPKQTSILTPINQSYIMSTFDDDKQQDVSLELGFCYVST